MTSRTTSSAISEELVAKQVRRPRVLPFELRWSFGINPDVPVLNLTTETQTSVAYVCSHVVIILDYRSNTATALQGHRNAVKTLSLSNNGKWLMSADFDEDNTVIIWDTESKLPARTLFNPHGRDKIMGAGISPNAKYIITVGKMGQHRRISLWFWTLGKDEPDFSFELSDGDGDFMQTKLITFSEEQPNCFACMSENGMDFFTWDMFWFGMIFTVRVVRVLSTPQIAIPPVAGTSIIEENLLECIKIVVHHFFRDKHWNLQICRGRNSMAVVGNAVGRISFYDNQLKLLYWCQSDSGDPDPILSISFDLRFTLHDQPVSTSSDSEFEKEEEEGCMEEKTDDQDCGIGDVLFWKEQGGRTSPAKHDTATVHESVKTSLDVPSANLERIPVRVHSPGCVRSNARSMNKRLSYVATDATLDHASFHVRNFLACTATGTLVLFDMQNLKSRFLFRNGGTIVTSIAAHPESCRVLVGMKDGSMRLYDYEKRQLIVSGKCPCISDFEQIVHERQKSVDGRMANDGTVVYVRHFGSYERLRAVTALRYSPLCDMVACGMENGAMWMLHPVTLEPLEEIPYKHSEDGGSIMHVAFDRCATYMAYADDAMTIAVFQRKGTEQRHDSIEPWPNMWRFIGKLRAHSSPIKDVLFGPGVSTGATGTSRLLSLGEDRELVEYDLESSGSYPHPGLMIRRVDKIESNAIPLCLAWYPQFDAEMLLVTATSEYKYRLLNDTTKTIRGTFLGPTFDTPVQRIEILTRDWRQRHQQQDKKRAYAIFATEKEIGIQLLPLDGNPYNAIGIVAHPSKVHDIAVGAGDEHLFTVGDSCVLMWKINLKSVDIMAHLGGSGLSPYYCLIDGGREGWLVNEMKDLFYYAQILHQGENTTSTRIVTDKVSTKQIPNLMRAVGYYPSNVELENMLSEVSYRHYAISGQLVEEITFEDWAKLYVNHRPVFGLFVHDVRNAFLTLVHDRSRFESDEDPSMSREDFLSILCGRNLSFMPTGQKNDSTLTGDPLTVQEVHTYLSLLSPSSPPSASSSSLSSLTPLISPTKDDVITSAHSEELLEPQNIFSASFQFLPARISYKDFITHIMGIVSDAKGTTGRLKTTNAWT